MNKLTGLEILLHKKDYISLFDDLTPADICMIASKVQKQTFKQNIKISNKNNIDSLTMKIILYGSCDILDDNSTIDILVPGDTIGIDCAVMGDSYICEYDIITSSPINLIISFEIKDYKIYKYSSEGICKIYRNMSTIMLERQHSMTTGIRSLIF